MGIIRDISEKIRHWRAPPVIIYAEDHAERLTCSFCGCQYVSRGKFDPGICRDCEREETENSALLIGGPCAGEKAGDVNDEN